MKHRHGRKKSTGRQSERPWNQRKRDETITSNSASTLSRARLFPPQPAVGIPLCDQWVCRRQRAELSPWISTSGRIFSSMKSSSFYACANQSLKYWSEVGHRDLRKDTLQTIKASHLVESMFVTTQTTHMANNLKHRQRTSLPVGSTVNVSIS